MKLGTDIRQNLEVKKERAKVEDKLFCVSVFWKLYIEYVGGRKYQ